MSNSLIDQILYVMHTRGLPADENDVRAILAAMREPTDEMRLAGQYPPTLEEIWNAMIDAALKGG